MTAEEVRQLLLASFPDAVINVDGESGNFNVEVISPVFENITKLNRQKRVLACVKDQIADGEIHAFSVKAFSQAERENDSHTLKVL
jgi:acid stress-induced BolA-like protein IbaG/YrbA